MSAREDILGRVRAALDGVEPGGEIPPGPRVAAAPAGDGRSGRGGASVYVPQGDR